MLPIAPFPIHRSQFLSGAQGPIVLSPFISFLLRKPWLLLCDRILGMDEALSKWVLNYFRCDSFMRKRFSYGLRFQSIGA